MQSNELILNGWLKKTDVWIVGLTAIIAILTLATACFISGQLTEMTKARIADERARIAPTGAKLDEEVRANKELRIRVLFENTGKEPALNLVHAYDWKPIGIEKDSEGEPFIDLQKVPWPVNNLCGRYQPDPFGRPIYPSAKYADIKYLFTGDERGKVPASLIEKTTSFVVWGCLIYRTSEATAWSPYCLYLQPHRTLPVEPQRLSE